MTRINREEILVPVLAKYYSDDTFYLNELKFYSRFDKDIIRADALYLTKPFGIAIIITNIYTNSKARSLLKSLNINNNFEKSEYNGASEIDVNLFDKESDFTFSRHVFKCKERIEIKLSKEKAQYFSLFISIAETELDHDIVSFIFSTWNASYSQEDRKNKEICFEKTYTQLSNKEIVELIKIKEMTSSDAEKNPFRDGIKNLDDNAYDLLTLNKNTFIGINFWRYEWKNKYYNNILDVTEYIDNNPHFFYSILTLDTEVYRRNFKNIMDYLAWGFSASKVHCGLFSRNVYISITLKPLVERYDYIGHDGTEFRSWEIIALQNCLLDHIYKSYQNCILEKSRTEELGKLIGELDRVYDFNSFIQKKGKGEIWIKFNKYLQEYIGITSYYELYEARHKRMQEIEEKKREEEDKAKSNRIAKSNLILSAFIFVTIFLSIIAIFFNNYQIHLNSFNLTVDACSSGEPLAFGIASLGFALLISIIFVWLFHLVFKYLELIE